MDFSLICFRVVVLVILPSLLPVDIFVKPDPGPTTCDRTLLLISISYFGCLWPVCELVWKLNGLLSTMRGASVLEFVWFASCNYRSTHILLKPICLRYI
jgi:hypothetical protein